MSACFLCNLIWDAAYRLLPEFQSSAPAKCKQACSLLLRLSEILLNAFTAVLSRLRSNELSSQYAATRAELLGTLLEHAFQWSNEGVIFPLLAKRLQVHLIQVVSP